MYRSSSICSLSLTIHTFSFLLCFIAKIYLDCIIFEHQTISIAPKINVDNLKVKTLIGLREQSYKRDVQPLELTHCHITTG